MGFQDGEETSWDLQLIRPGADTGCILFFLPQTLSLSLTSGKSLGSWGKE